MNFNSMPDDKARGYNVIHYQDSVIVDKNPVCSYVGDKTSELFVSGPEDLSVLVHIL